MLERPLNPIARYDVDTARGVEFPIDVEPMRPIGAEVDVNALRRAFGFLRNAFAPDMLTAVIDLSKWNTVVDWQALYNSGVRCVILRASFGMAGVDLKFAEYVQAAHAVGLLVMTYHYFDSTGGGAAQASHHWGLISQFFNLLGYVPVVWCDVEDAATGTSNSQRLNRVLSFLTTIKALQGVVGRCGIYSSPGFANAYLSPAPAWIVEYLQWVAHWTSAPAPITPSGWDVVPDVWQYGIWNDHAWVVAVLGCLADIDRDWFYGDFPALFELATGGEVEPPPDPEPDPVPNTQPKVTCWAKVTNEEGVKVRRHPANTQTIFGSLAKGTVVPVFERQDKANGEIWIHTTIPLTTQTGWSAYYFPPYGDDAQLMEFVLPPEE